MTNGSELIGLRWICALLLLCTQQPAMAAATDSLHFIGRAFNLDSGALVYTEEHTYNASGLYRVIYHEPSGEPFATKTADFSSARFAPNLEQDNARNGELVRIVREDPGTLRASYRAASNKSTSTVDIAISGNTVIDAGFHPFILAHWDDLVHGVIERIDYVVPSWLRSVALTISTTRCADASRQCFRIKPANTLLAIFADSIELTYDAQSHQLLEFRGTSNIAQRNGHFERVRIAYEYAPAIAASTKLAH